MNHPIYLDYASTTPVDPRVAEKMMQFLTMDGVFGNAASRSHVYGWQAEEAVENARSQVAELIGAENREIVWTSGATESNNLAIKGAAQAALYASDGAKKHIVTSSIEHKAVLDTCAFMGEQGFEITYLSPGPEGLVTVQQLERALREDTVLVSLMHVNNEIGTINDVASFGKICREAGVLFHVDAAQSPGKLDIDVVEMNIDLMSLSGHKIYGPKGVGALYVRRRPKLDLNIQIHGGGHERGMRSGTLPTHQIVGMGEAAAICKNEMAAEQKRIFALRERFREGIMQLEGVTVNGTLEARVAGNLNVSFSDVDGETLLMSLRNLAVSTGSACVSVSIEPSYVLRALGVCHELAHASIRFSIGRFTTEGDIETAIDTVVKSVTQLRKLTA